MFMWKLKLILVMVTPRKESSLGGNEAEKESVHTDTESELSVDEVMCVLI